MIGPKSINNLQLTARPSIGRQSVRYSRSIIRSFNRPISRSTNIPKIISSPLPSPSMYVGPQPVPFPEAPIDGIPYERENASWVQAAGSVTESALVTVSDTAPANPAVGTLWFDTVGIQMYIFWNDGTSSQWTVVVNR